MGQNLFGAYQNMGFGHVTVILHNWAKNRPNMSVAAPQAPVGGWGSETPSKVCSLVLVC